MDRITITPEQQRLIERLQVLHERSGFPPSECRILALLLVSDETELTFDEIREVLKLSKSATSNALNKLLVTEKIEYVSRMGDRKRYFRSNIGHWEAQMEKDFKGLLHINSLFKEILAQRPKSTKEFNRSLREVTEFLDYFKDELPTIFRRWKEKRK